MSRKAKHATPALSDLDVAILEWLTARANSDHTRKAYRRNVEMFLTGCGKPFLAVEIADLREYQKRLANVVASKKMARATMARRMAAVKSFYRWLARDGQITLALDSLEPIKQSRAIKREKLISEAEVKALLRAAAPDPVAHLLVRFLYLTGLRISEALGARWRDLEPLKIGGRLPVHGKGGKFRQVFLPAELWADLLEWRGDAPEDGFLFPALDSMKAWRLMRKLGVAAKIARPITPHCLRHAHASHSLDHGATIAEVQEQLGHGSITTTSLYVHASGERSTASRLKIK